VRPWASRAAVRDGSRVLRPLRAGGLRPGDGGHGACRAARKLEPPRYCAQCGRRTVVKVTPGGWSSHCARHGLVTDAG
jgi:hypothetical protein